MDTLRALGFMANFCRQRQTKEKVLWHSCGFDVTHQACFVFYSTVYIAPQVTDPDTDTDKTNIKLLSEKTEESQETYF